jgi:heat shock protein HslJ
MMRVALQAAMSLLVAWACSPKSPSSDQPPAAQPPTTASTASLDGRDWVLVDLGGQPAPPGADGRPATIRFDTATRRATGFAGCNRYSAQYTLAGDSLSFGPAMSTKMACADGDELERRYLAVLPEVGTYESSDSTITLNGSGGPLARFRAP